MKMKFSDLEEAFLFVSSDAPYMNEVALRKSTGELYYRSELVGVDEIPSDADDSDEYLWIPSFRDLGLDARVVRAFVESEIPEHREEVASIFSRRGAYGRFKGFLATIEKLEAWFGFESERQRQAVREWCQLEGVELED